MSEFERIIADSMGPFYNMDGQEISENDILDDLNMSMDEYNSLPDYIPGYDDGEWLDDFQGEKEFA